MPRYPDFDHGKKDDVLSACVLEEILNPETSYRGKDEKLLELIGATITNVGFIPYRSSGGMAVDYTKGGEAKRMVFGYTELGIWVLWNGVKK